MLFRLFARFFTAKLRPGAERSLEYGMLAMAVFVAAAGALAMPG